MLSVNESYILANLLVAILLMVLALIVGHGF